MSTANLQCYRRITRILSPDFASIGAILCRHRKLHNGPDTIEELLDRHLVKEDKSRHEDDEESQLLARRRLTSSRREVLSLYRDILRATRFFMWSDPRGVTWRDVLRDNARREFEEARFEKDPEVITRLLIGGRDAVNQALENLAEKHRQQIEKGRGPSNWNSCLIWGTTTLVSNEKTDLYYWFWFVGWFGRCWGYDWIRLVSVFWSYLIWCGSAICCP